MEHKEVFISYKSEDFDQANWLKTVLETNGISCWMAPASIPGGSNYAREIPQAIEGCKVFVLVLTKRCQQSIWVPKELDRALNAQKPVMPFMLENCQLNDDFNFYLSNVQRYAAYQNKANAAQQLLRDIRALLNVAQEPIRQTAPSFQLKKNGKKVLIGAVVILLLAASLFGKLDLDRIAPTPQESQTAAPAVLSSADGEHLREKTETFLRGKGVDRLSLWLEDGSSDDLYADAMSQSFAGLSLLQDAYTYREDTLILPFKLSLEDVPYSWIGTVYYEEPLLVDYPALYGYAVFKDVAYDQKGNLIYQTGFHLTISDLYETQGAMEVSISQDYPNDLAAITVAAHN